MKQALKTRLIRIVAESFKAKNPNARYDLIYREATKWLDRLEAFESADVDLLTSNILEAESHIALARRDLDAAEKLQNGGFNAWSIYVTNKSVERVAKAHSAITNDVEAKDIGHRYTEWILDVFNDGPARHLAKVLIAASGRQIGKNEIRNRLKKSRVLKSRLSKPETALLWAGADDVQGCLDVMDGLIDLFVQRTGPAIQGSEIRRIIVQVTNAVKEFSDDPDELAATEFWLGVDADGFKNFHVEQSVVYVRLMFLGLLLQPHDNSSRYFDQGKQAPTPFDYDRLDENSSTVPGIVSFLPQIRESVAKTVDVTGQMIVHQRLTFLGSPVDDVTLTNAN